MSGEQLPLGLPHRPALGRAQFVVGRANAEAMAWIERWPDWPAPALVLTGPEGAGKSHLARIWRERAAARAIPPAALAAAELPLLLGDARAVSIDPADAAPEELLLHLFNMVAERGGHLLIVAREAPARWNIGLADLRSRLLGVPMVEVGTPDEDLLAALVAKLFADRGITASDNVERFIARRIERSFAAAHAAVALLDRAALAQRRDVTVALASRVFDWRDDEGEPSPGGRDPAASPEP